MADSTSPAPATPPTAATGSTPAPAPAPTPAPQAAATAASTAALEIISADDLLALQKDGLVVLRRESHALSRYGSFDIVTTKASASAPARCLAVVKYRAKLTDPDIQKEVPPVLQKAQAALAASAAKPA